jgi:hypothetical protein
MKEVGREGATFGNLKKQEIRSAVDAVDQWIEDNTVSFNSALPLAARTTMPARQKTKLFMMVVRQRFNLE